MTARTMVMAGMMAMGTCRMIGAGRLVECAADRRLLPICLPILSMPHALWYGESETELVSSYSGSSVGQSS